MKSKVKVIIPFTLVVLLSVSLMACKNSADAGSNVQPSVSSAVGQVDASAEDGIKIIKDIFPDSSSLVFSNEEKDANDKKILTYKDESSEYQIDAKTRKIVYVFKKGLASDSASSGNEKVDIEKNKEKSVNFIKTVRPDIDTSSMMLTVSEMAGANITVYQWRKYKNNVDVGNFVNVMISSSGEIVSFLTRDGFPSIDTANVKISEDQALSIAGKYAAERYPGIKIAINSSNLVAVNDQMVLWKIQMSGTTTNEGLNSASAYEIFVDSITGEVKTDEEVLALRKQ